MEIQLDLGRHCIKTEIKRQYDRSINEYFKTQNPELEEKIEFLKDVLENVDLIGLRGKYQELAGNSDADVRIVLHDGNIFEVIIDSESVWQESLSL
ncbi:MAG: hypothetical protein ACOCZ2_01420 [Thermodesulfobacteriota bacterium]